MKKLIVKCYYVNEYNEIYAYELKRIKKWPKSL